MSANRTWIALKDFGIPTIPSGVIIFLICSQINKEGFWSFLNWNIPLWIVLIILITIICGIWIIVLLKKQNRGREVSCNHGGGEIDIFRPFSEVREINSSKKNSCKIDSSYVLRECGTIMCWIYVSPLGEGIRDLQNNRYIFAHISKQEPPQYYNRFSIGCLGKKGEKRWEVTLTNNKPDKPESSLLTIVDKLETGWHHFMFSWNRKKKQMSFFIDLGKNGNDLKPVVNWPEKLGDNLVIGAWARENDGHYCNTKIAYPEIIDTCLDWRF